VRADRGCAEAMRLEEVVRGAVRAIAVVDVAGRVEAQQVATLAKSLRLVDRARVPDQVSERLRGAIAVTLEKRRKPIAGETATVVQPAGQREVVEGEDGGEPMLVARTQNAAIVVEGG
jgi:hypothetical protein